MLRAVGSPPMLLITSPTNMLSQTSRLTCLSGTASFAATDSAGRSGEAHTRGERGERQRSHRDLIESEVRCPFAPLKNGPAMIEFIAVYIIHSPTAHLKR